MATSSRSTERFKYGICLNDECPLCKEKKIQQIPMRKDLVCTNPDCGKPLRECPPPKTGPNKKLIGIIATAVLGIAAIICVIFALTNKQPKGDGGGGETDSIPQTKVELVLTLNHTMTSLKVGEYDTLNVTITPEGTQAAIEWLAISMDGNIEVQDGIVKAVKEGSGKVQVKAIVGTDTVKAVCAYTIEAVEKEVIQETEKPGRKKHDDKEGGATSGTLKLSYGTYTGKIVNGYPNGQGRLIYSRPRQINKFDSKGRTANAGDVVQGVFKNGFFTVGKHYDSAGNMIESINVGVAEDAYDQK